MTTHSSSLVRFSTGAIAAGCLVLGLFWAETLAQSPAERMFRGDSLVPSPHRETPAIGDENRRNAREEKEAGEEEKKDDDKEPELPPGLLGYRLHGRGGLKAEYLYTGEILTNMRGGVDTNDDTEYRGLFSLALTADLEQMHCAPGGKFFLLGENTHGRSLTEWQTGDFQWLSSIGGPEFTQVSEYWWERSFWDGQLTVRLGKQDGNIDFAVVDLGGDFINSSFGMHPTIPMPSWPYNSMGVVVLWKLADSLAFKSGVWDGTPEIGTWGFSGDGTTFSICELEAQYKLGNRLPGDCHVGVWYHSGQFADLAMSGPLGSRGPLGAWDDGFSFSRKTRPGNQPVGPLGAADGVRTGNHGVYCGLEQLLFAEPVEPPGDKDAKGDDKDEPAEEAAPDEGGSPQGLGVFFQYGWAPEDRNEAEHYFGSGIVYKGLLHGRDDDVLGLGVAYVGFSDLLPQQTSETAVELFYKAQLSPWTILEPDLQYIARPNGQQRDAFVFGLRFEVAL
jgi:porin